MDSDHTLATDSPQSPNRRALWPWVMSGIVLMLAALGLSFWWPMHRAGIVIEFLEGNHGYYQAQYNHPEWTNFFLGKRTFHPWFDEIDQINTNSARGNESFLKNLSSIRGLKELDLHLKSGSESSTESLSKLDQLEKLRLWGNHSNIPSQSFVGLKNLKFLQLGELVLDDSLWKTVTEDLDLPYLSLLSCRFEGEVSNPKNSKLTKLFLYFCELDESFGKGIAELSSLESLVVWGDLNIDFLRQVGTNRSLKDLSIRSKSVNQTEWDFICQIETLDTLSIWVSDSISSAPALRSLSSISRSKNLREFSGFGNSSFTESNYDYLGELSNLKTLELHGMKFTYGLLWGIASIPQLTELHLGCQNTQPTDWLILTNCKSLKTLSYTNDCSFRDVAEEFKKARRDVEVTQR